MASNTWPPKGGGVQTLNNLRGALTLTAGANVSITDNGSNQITIASSGGGGGGSNTFLDTNSINLTDAATFVSADLKLSAASASASNKLVTLSIESDGLKAQILDSSIRSALSVTDTSTIDLTYSSGAISADIIALSITNALVSASAAIAYSKLALSNSIVNADINSSAAIAYSKLSLSNSILNADINASAAIALTKLAATTASRVLVSDGSGFVSPSSVTATTLGFLDATSSVQTQLNAKLNLSGGTMSGAIAMGTNKITGAGDPTNPQDVATKAYVDSVSPAILTNSTFTGTTITAGTGPIQKFRYTGLSEQTLSALTFSSLPDGARIIITGSSDTNTLTIPVGLANVSINGERVLAQYSTIELIKDGTQLIEVSRNGI